MIHTDGTPTIAWADDAPGIHPDDYRAPTTPEPTREWTLDPGTTASRVWVDHNTGEHFELARFLFEGDADDYLKIALETRPAPSRVWVEHP
jgi:hypothetical protein